MPDFELLPPEQSILERVLRDFAGTRLLGAEDDWLFSKLLDSVPPRDQDDESQSGLQNARRLISLRVVVAGCLTPTAADRAMAEAWALGNSPEELIDRGEWIAAFAVTGFTSDPDDPFEPPGEAVRLWRGSPPELKEGLAWTSEPSVAEDVFAADLRKRGLDGRVFSATVGPERVLARYNNHEEREWVVDTRGLLIIEV